MSSAITKTPRQVPARGARDLAEASQVHGARVRETVIDLADATKESFKNAPAAAKIGHRPSRAIPVNAISPTLLAYQYDILFYFNRK